MPPGLSACWINLSRKFQTNKLSKKPVFQGKKTGSVLGVVLQRLSFRFATNTAAEQNLWISVRVAGWAGRLALPGSSVSCASRGTLIN